MATNYTLENAIFALVDRATELKGAVENDTPDLEFVMEELSGIEKRAAHLQNVAHTMNEALESI